MALDAHVYCDCFERGWLRCPPPADSNPSVCDHGGLLCGSDDLNVQIAFDFWRRSEACEHENCCLVAHRIGNITLVAALRAELGQWPERFRVILSRVIYNGVHGGDFIALPELQQLVTEIEALAEIHCADPDMEQLLRGFEQQMWDLVAAALSVGKPVVF